MFTDDTLPFWIAVIFTIAIAVVIAVASMCGWNPADRGIIHVKFDKVDVAELVDALRLERSTQRECAGSSPAIDTNRRINMIKDWKHYENNDGRLIIAYYGLSRPMNESDPFMYGYWVSLDLNGSEQFIPKLDFEKEFREVKKPE